jgi:hypothetical protein
MEALIVIGVIAAVVFGIGGVAVWSMMQYDSFDWELEDPEEDEDGEGEVVDIRTRHVVGRQQSE